ncbi:MAG: hypothetical protein ACRC6N_11035 [Plesiomonas sp.]|uniref:hypothetical protein n=1 Tax=Plesiomonas sp. TaxID=2486279 RepID=UPI003F2F9C65
MSVTPYATYFLVATAIGGKPQRQKVCIADHGSYLAAKKAADKLDAKICAKAIIQAEADRRKKILDIAPAHKGKPWVIANNFKAEIEYKPARRGRSPEIAPVFRVVYKNDNGRLTAFTVRIRACGSIHAAFIEAASFYADLYGLTREQRTELMSREPSKELFTETLHSRFVERKGVITGAFEKILMSIDH